VSTAATLVAAEEPIVSARVRLLELARDYPRVTAAICFVALLFLVALLAPVISPHDPIATEPDNAYLPPLSPSHLLGTVGLIVGGLIGLVSGFRGHLTDLLLMRLIDALLAFPALILAIAIVAALGANLTNAMVAIGVVAVPVYARLVRGQVLQLREMEFITATRSLGATPLRLVFRHLVPNLLNPIIVQVSLSAGFAILAEATLSFLGLGAQVPTPDWGQMINSGTRFLNNDPWLAIVPGVAISITVYSFNFLGDSLRDALDPRLRS